MSKLCKSRSKLDHESSIEMRKFCKFGLASVLVLALAVGSCQAESEPSSSVQAIGDASNEQFTPKRQYFIAPRIGRSMQQPNSHLFGGKPAARERNTQTIWSSLEEGGVLMPGQIQPNRGYPGPLRSSLLFLIGNRRLIGPRSASGLLPQARIGRRASPSGLLPQPRVGRRSFTADSPPFEMSGLEFGVIGNAEPNQPDGAIARPASRAATGFVPRLGKRFDRAGAAVERMSLLEALLRRISSQNGYNPPLYSSPPSPPIQLYAGPQMGDRLEIGQERQSLEDTNLMDLLVPRREIRASEGSDELISLEGGILSASGSKRVAFTPRIGR